MKTTVIVLIVIGFLWYCVSLANDNRNAKMLPELTNGLTYKITKDKFEPGVDRYEVNVRLNQEASEKDVKEISEWVKRNRKESETFIIFYFVPEKKGAWARVDYPGYKFELMPKLEY